MSRAKNVMASFRLLESFLLSHISPARSLHIRVTHNSLLSYLSKEDAHGYAFLNTQRHQKVFFSSNPATIVELLTTNEWSKELENELLEKSNATTLLTHETISYVLMNLEGTPQKALAFFEWVSGKHGFKPSSLVYCLMLRVLSNWETINEFWGLAKKMSNEGWIVDKRTVSIITGNLKNSKLRINATAWMDFFPMMTQKRATDATVKAVCDTVLKSEWNEDVEKKLGDIKLNLSENIILGILWTLEQYPLKALYLFCWLREHKGYEHNAVSYNAILRVLGQEDSHKEFWSVVEELKGAGHYLDMDTYMKVSRVFHRSGMMADAVGLYELMMVGPYKPPVKEFTSVLREISMSNNPDVKLVCRVVKKYEEAGHSLSKAAYDWIYRSLTNAGELNEAEKTLETMRSLGFQPDNITYFHGLFVLFRVGKVEEANKKLDEMELEGCIPDIMNWTWLIRGLCTAGEVDQAIKCFNMMKAKNFEANVHILEALANGLCSKTKVDRAYNLVIESVNTTKLRPSLSTYNNLIEKLLEEAKFQEALNLLCLMMKHDFPLFKGPYIRYITKSGTLKDAWDFIEVGDGKALSPEVYFQIVQSFFKEGRQSEAQEFLGRCPYHIPHNADLFDLLPSLKLGNAVDLLSAHDVKLGNVANLRRVHRKAWEYRGSAQSPRYEASRCPGSTQSP